jgi:hypothetical protein
VAFSIVWLVLIAAFTPKRLKGRLGLANKRNRTRLALVAAAGAVTALVISGYAFTREWRRYGKTLDGLQQLSQRIAEHHAAGQPVPGDTQALRDQLRLGQGALTDAWGRPIVLRKDYPDWHDGDSLVSAGTDGRLETADDVMFLIELAQAPD